MTAIAQTSLLVLSVFMILGGIMGFVKAKSKASLISGVGSGIVLALCYALVMSGITAGMIAALVVTIALDVVFAIRLKKTKKLMPSGMLLAINVIVQAIIALSLFGGSHGS